MDSQSSVTDGSHAAATALYAQHRDVLFTVVYDMLGSVTDTEDALQETWLRWSATRLDDIGNPRGYLVRIAVNEALRRLRTLRDSRESYVGPWLPEPVCTTGDAADRLVRAETVSLAVLALLERLSPLERAVFVLHEVFGYEHKDVAAILGRTPAAVRQLSHRARQHIGRERPRFQPEPGVWRAATERFMSAAVGGDVTRLMEVLAPQVTLWSDGGGRIRTTRRVVHGRDRLLRLLWAAPGYLPAGLRAHLVEVNGGPAVAAYLGGDLHGIVVVDPAPDGRTVHGVYSILNPDKLAAVAAALGPDPSRYPMIGQAPLASLSAS